MVLIYFFFHIADLTVTPWSSWSSCNISCGNGHKNRSRTCRIANCKETKSDFNTCTVACPVGQYILKSEQYESFEMSD